MLPRIASGWAAGLQCRSDNISAQSRTQILNLLENIQHKLKLTLLFISHDLRAVQHISDRICVMYLGKILEVAPAMELHARPLMPYTIALISAVPAIGSARPRSRMVLTGDVPSPYRSAIRVPVSDEGARMRFPNAHGSIRHCGRSHPDIGRHVSLVARRPSHRICHQGRPLS